MAGTVSMTERSIGAVRQITFAWTSDASGNATATTTSIYDGLVLYAVFVPGSPTPTNLYNVVVNDGNTVDVLAGYGKSLSSAATVDTRAATLAGGLGIGAVSDSTLSLSISAAGNATQGTVILYIS